MSLGHQRPDQKCGNGWYVRRRTHWQRVNVERFTDTYVAYQVVQIFRRFWPARDISRPAIDPGPADGFGTLLP